jgi:hypothetical protein
MTLHKGRLFLSIKILVLISALLTPCVSCQSTQRGDRTAQAAGTPAGPTQTLTSERTVHDSLQKDDQTAEDRTVLAVSKAVHKNHLTDREDECLAYQFDPGPDKDFYSVDVRENHRYAKCGGDPNTSPRLFSVRVSKKTGKMSTDQGSPAGTFRPLPD